MNENKGCVCNRCISNNNRVSGCLKGHSCLEFNCVECPFVECGDREEVSNEGDA